MAKRYRSSGVRLKTISHPRGYAVRCGAGDEDCRAAYVWSYIASNRKRWYRNDSAHTELTDLCVQQLTRLGINERKLSELAAERVIEVTIPEGPSARGDYPPKIMPWEFLLKEALLAWEAQPLIVRHLKPAATRPRRVPQLNPRALLVIGARKLLKEDYGFDTEVALVPRILRLRTETDDLTLAQVAKTIDAEQPDIIHVGGVDNHQGAHHFGFETKSQKDGVVFAADDGEPQAINFDEVAATLTVAERKPSLVVINVYHSAARLAPATVAAGARVAVGIQDTCDDVQAEWFLGQFYRAWDQLCDPVISAYVAWQSQSLDEYVSDRPLGIVIWSDLSQIDSGLEKRLERAESLGKQLAEKRKPALPFQTRQAARQAVSIVVTPMSGLNYSLLHNRQPMFTSFEIRNLDEARTIEDLQIEVELFAGQERAFYATNETVGNAPVALREQVFVPLTSTLSRSLKAIVQAGLRVRVSVGEHQGIYDETFRVRMRPVNEWVDDDENRQWLPSFVYPLDPAIQKVIEAALPFQSLLTEEPKAQFAGYQVFDAEGMDDGQARKALDAQIEAIWSALVIGHEVSGSRELNSLTYMNPPPSFTEHSQRLRSPSEVLKTGHGTCIDLALLLCSAMEYIDVHPVVFLLEGHAMPGYWRSESAWRDFANMIDAQEFSTRDVERRLLNRGGEPQEHSWVFLKLFYEEIFKQIRAGNLVPLESVGLTNFSRFKTAHLEARKKLEEPGQFHSMIDIRLARESRVTPLPLIY